MDAQPTPLILRAGRAPRLDVFGVTVTPLLGGDQTRGACSMARIDCAPGTGAPPHRHAHDEAFLILSGAVALRCGEETTVLEAGDFATVPGGTVHAFQNTGEGPASLINLGLPAGHELFFRDADALARSGRFSPETAAGLCRRHAIELVV